MSDTEGRWNRLKEARELRQLSQVELGTLTAIDPANISKFEAGKRKPSIKNLSKLAEALECSTDYLMGLSDFITPTVNECSALMELDFLQRTHEQDVSKSVDRIKQFIRYAGVRRILS